MLDAKECAFGSHLEYYEKSLLTGYRVHEHEAANSFEEMDGQLGHTNFKVVPFACPGCGNKHNSETLTHKPNPLSTGAHPPIHYLQPYSV